VEDTAVQSLPRWEHFEHGADVGVRGLGRSPAAAFEQAALALTAVITAPGDVTPRETRTLKCAAPDACLLLVDWLNAVIYEMAVEDMLFSSYAVETDGRSLTAICRGEHLDRGRHRPAVEPKGATQTALRVGPVDGTWIAQCVVDV
jgi:SHS2 domain-containing protein